MDHRLIMKKIKEDFTSIITK